MAVAARQECVLRERQAAEPAAQKTGLPTQQHQQRSICIGDTVSGAAIRLAPVAGSLAGAGWRQEAAAKPLEAAPQMQEAQPARACLDGLQQLSSGRLGRGAPVDWGAAEAAAAQGR